MLEHLKHRRLRHATLAAAVCLAATTSFADTAMLGPEVERHIPRLIAPWVLGGEVQPGVRIAGISIQRQDIRIAIASVDATATLRLDLRGSEDAAGARMSRTFVLRVEPDPVPAPLGGAVALVMESVVRNDDGEILSLAKQTGRATVAAATGDGAKTRVHLLLAAAGWFALATLGLSAVLRIRPWHRLRNPWVLACLACVGASGALRATAPTTLLHANNHGIEDLAAVVGRGPLDPDPGAFVRVTGPSGLVAQRAVARLMGRSDLAVFDGAVVWGTLATAATAASAWVVTGSPVGAVSAAILHATWPLAGRVARSESLLAVVVFLIALLPGLLHRVRAHPGWTGAAGAALVCGLAGTAHPVGILACGASLAVFLPWRPGMPTRRGSVAGWALAAAVVAATAVPRWLLMADQAGGEVQRIAALGLLPLDSYLLVGHGWTPPALLALAIAGALTAAMAGSGSIAIRLARGGMALVATAMFLFILRFRFTGFGDALRYQSLATPLVAILVGQVPVRLFDLAKAKLPARMATLARSAAVAAIAWLAASCALERGPWITRDAEALDYEVAAEFASRLPPGALVVVPEDPAPAGIGKVFHDFPGFAGTRSGRRVEVMGESTWRQRRETGGMDPERTFLWRGSSCQAVADKRVQLLSAGGRLNVRERIECRRLVAQWGAEPFAQARIPIRDGGADFRTFHDYVDPVLDVVLYRVHDRPRPDAGDAAWIPTAISGQGERFRPDPPSSR